jgi:hypothetical protein
MKYLLLTLLSLIVLSSCGVKVPLTNQIKEEYSLNASTIKGVQFFVSSEIILERSSQKGSSGTTSDGTLVSSSSKDLERIVILPRTKCVFEKYGTTENAVLIRFEVGQGKFITFATRPNMDGGKLYLQADWQQGKGGKINYGNDEYFATAASGNAYLMVKIKKSQRTKRKDRVVKGMKV